MQGEAQPTPAQPAKPAINRIQIVLFNMVMGAVMAVILVGAYALLTKEGGLLTGWKWDVPIIFWIPRRLLGAAAIGSLLWTLLLRHSPWWFSFMVCFVSLNTYEVIAHQGNGSPIVAGVIACLCAVLIYAISAFTGTASADKPDFPKEEYDAAQAHLEAGRYAEANEGFGRLLADASAYSQERLRELTLKRLICMAKLGQVEEARAAIKPEPWLDAAVWEMVKANYRRMEGLHEVKPVKEIASNTDVEVAAETVDWVKRSANEVAALDRVFRFDNQFGPSLYYHLAFQAQFIRLYEGAAALCKRGLESRPDRAGKLEINPISRDRLYDLLGDVYFKLGRKREAFDAYDTALKIDGSLVGTKIKRDRLQKELSGVK